MKSGIYIITNVDNGKVYVGSSTDTRRRWQEHLAKIARSNQIRAFQKQLSCTIAFLKQKLAA